MTNSRNSTSISGPESGNIWIEDPASKSAQVFVLEEGHYAIKDFGVSEGKLSVNSFEDCVIDLFQVFSE